MKYLKINEDCKFVTGHKRSVIYDLGNENYHFIPNALCELANTFDKKAIEEIYVFYGKSNEKYISEYLSFLIDKKFAIICTKEQCDIFQPLNFEWHNPSTITNAIIEINTDIDYKSIIKQLEHLGCYHLELRSNNILQLFDFNNILQLFENTAIKSINIILKYNNDIEGVKELINQYKRISSVILHSSPENQIINEMVHFTLIKKQLIRTSDFLTISQDFFNVNIPLFTESQKYNTYFNRKVTIDYQGNIKNCLNIDENFGNINEDRIGDIIDKIDFSKYWLVSKDDIQICCDCEFRYMCVDTRKPCKDKNGKWHFETDCNYDPYTSQWKNDYE